jgi:hypothetical protein
MLFSFLRLINKNIDLFVFDYFSHFNPIVGINAQHISTGCFITQVDLNLTGIGFL